MRSVEVMSLRRLPHGWVCALLWVEEVLGGDVDWGMGVVGTGKERAREWVGGWEMGRSGWKGSV